VVPPHFAAPGRCVGNALPRSLDHGSGLSRLRALCPAYGQAVPLLLALRRVFVRRTEYRLTPAGGSLQFSGGDYSSPSSLS